MNEAFIGFLVWLLSSYFCLFNPSSSFGKKVIFCSWILGPCKVLCFFLFKVPALSILAGMSAMGTIAAILLAYFYGECVIDKLNPNASRIKYIVIGFISSVLLSNIITGLFS